MTKDKEYRAIAHELALSLHRHIRCDDYYFLSNLAPGYVTQVWNAAIDTAMTHSHWDDYTSFAAYDTILQIQKILDDPSSQLTEENIFSGGFPSLSDNPLTSIEWMSSHIRRLKDAERIRVYMSGYVEMEYIALTAWQEEHKAISRAMLKAFNEAVKDIHAQKFGSATQ